MGKAQAKPGDIQNLSSREIEAEIEQTRAAMDRTVDELTEQLRLQHLLDRVMGHLKSESSQAGTAAREAGQWVLKSMARHPLPIALIGTGVAWLVMQVKSKREESREPEFIYEPQEVSGVYPMSSESGFEKSISPGISEQMGSEYETEGCEVSEQAKGRFEETKERISQAGSRAKSRASETAGKVSQWSREKWHNLKHRGEETQAEAYEKAERARYGLRHRMEDARARLDLSRDKAAKFFDEYPLVIGVSALALGLFVGLALPASRRERRVLGPKASRWRERVTSEAEHLMERGKEAAHSTAEAIKEEARRQGLTPSELKESAMHVLRGAGETAQEEGFTPEGIVDKFEAVADEAAENIKDEIHRE